MSDLEDYFDDHPGEVESEAIQAIGLDAYCEELLQPRELTDEEWADLVDESERMSAKAGLPL